MTHSRQGFSVIEVFLVIIFICLLGGLGYVGYTRFLSPTTPSASTHNTSSSQEKSTSAPKEYSSDKDLDTATSELEEVQLEETEDDASLSSNASQL